MFFSQRQHQNKKRQTQEGSRYIRCKPIAFPDKLSAFRPTKALRKGITTKPWLASCALVDVALNEEIYLLTLSIPGMILLSCLGVDKPLDTLPPSICWIITGCGTDHTYLPKGLQCCRFDTHSSIRFILKSLVGYSSR